MKNLIFLSTISLAAGCLLLIVGCLIRRRTPWTKLSVLRVVLTGFAVWNIVFVLFLWFNHVGFPLNLEIMEGTILQHVRRAISMAPIYPSPTPAYVPLSYNPLYYVMAVPFTWVFGASLSTLRVLTIIGTIGSVVIIARVVRTKTGSAWWTLISVGLFAASYHAMDHFFDVAHADMWMLFSVLLGTSIIALRRSMAWNLLGVVILVAAFWFKQHGAWFAVGGMLYLTWREGLKRSVPYWVVAAGLGPVLYFVAGPALFGSDFVYFTWEMPRGWMELSLGTFRTFVGWVLKFSPLMSLSAAGYGAWVLLKRREELDVWAVQFVPAVLCGALGALDPGSSYNNLIPMGVWFIVFAVTCFAAIEQNVVRSSARSLVELVLAVSFGVLIYDPALVVVPSDSTRKYGELVEMLKRLPGPVYAPSIGELQRDYTLFPTAHWVALEDMIRGPGKDTRNHPNTRRLLDPVIHPEGEAFILAYFPLTYYPWLAFLDDCYVVEEDFGEYYSSLGVLRVRYEHGFPRYVYRFSPEKASAQGRE